MQLSFPTHPHVTINCKKVKDLLAEKGYAYTELNVETDANAKELFQKLQAPGVPVMLVGDREIIGYDPDGKAEGTLVTYVSYYIAASSGRCHFVESDSLTY